MRKKYNPGSAGEKEQKQFRSVILPFFAIVTVAALLLSFVIPSELRDNVKATPGWLNWLGGILQIVSLGVIGKAYSAGEEGSWGYTIGWAVLLAAGFFIAAGGYAYTY